MPTQIEDVVRVVVDSVEGDRVTVVLPGTNYQLQLRVSRDSVSPTAGQRLKGVIEARGLRIHAAHGGGRFIEPAWGAPRIVAGCVVRLDDDGHRVLVDVAAPMWITLPERQDRSLLRPGTLVNCYLESGASFSPATE